MVGIAGVDVQDLVDGLMVYQRQGLVRMNQKQELLNVQKSAYAELKQFITTFQKNFADFQALLNHRAYKAESLNENIVSVATTGEKLAAGEYEINVTQLAHAHQIASKGFDEGSQSLELTGDLTIEVAGSEMTVSVDSDDSLESIKDKINQSSLNPGVTASIMKTTGAGGVDEYRIVLTSDTTGSANEINLSGTIAADLDLSNELQAAQNALLTFNGFSVERDSNYITDLMDGMSIHLNGELGSTVVSIKEDNTGTVSQLKEQFQGIIESYNQVMQFLAKNKAHPSFRDSTYPLIQKSLQSIMRDNYGNGSLKALFELGIKTSKSKVDVIEVKDNENNVKQIEYAVTGLIEINDSTFDEIFGSHIDEIRAMFNGDDGLIKAVDEISDHLETETIFNREKIIDEQSRRFNDRIFREENRLKSVRERLIAQYTEVEKIISNYEMMGDFLDKQLDAMSGKLKK
ncbi:flagellar filament capping protein FliD [Legionella israelensis]|uniref:flagellar filament capping protein FliD n=1 Tax=Legionella israelensis TaxID=454 RepID=UPI00163DE475|nr:flagellar filament capping protein FliD [Legionella israelensis]